VVDDKAKYTDWSQRADIKAELKVDLIILLAENGYPPVDRDEVYKEIFEQAENFKKYQGAWVAQRHPGSADWVQESQQGRGECAGGEDWPLSPRDAIRFQAFSTSGSVVQYSRSNWQFRRDPSRYDQIAPYSISLAYLEGSHVTAPARW